MRRLVTAIVVAAAVGASLAPAALAHSYLLRSSPAYGEVLSSAPREIRLSFSDSIQPAPGIEAVSNATGRSILAGRTAIDPHNPRELALPLIRRLPEGDYTARWRVVSNDGHTEEGLLAFAVGSSRSPPTAGLPLLGTGPGATGVLGRWLFVLGTLLALGAVVFAAAVWRPALRAAQLDADDEIRLRNREARIISIVLFACFVGAQAGSVLAILHGTTATRYGRMHELAIVFAGVGAAATAGTSRPLRLMTGIAALALATTLPLSGHALDPGESQPLSLGADLVHVYAAAIWIGGLLQLTLALRAGRGLEPAKRNRLASQQVRLFSRLALIAVVLIAISGLARALVELADVRQLWNLNYGRAIVVKSVLFAAVLALAWFNRKRLSRLPAGSELPGPVRPGLAIASELALLAAVVAAVAVLTDLRPGRTPAQNPSAAAAVPRSGYRSACARARNGPATARPRANPAWLSSGNSTPA